MVITPFYLFHQRIQDLIEFFFYDCTLSCHQPNKTRLEVQLHLLWTVDDYPHQKRFKINLVASLRIIIFSLSMI